MLMCRRQAGSGGLHRRRPNRGRIGESASCGLGFVPDDDPVDRLCIVEPALEAGLQPEIKRIIQGYICRVRVVLLHGLTNSRRAFGRLLPLLDDFDVTALDLPGHGAKARPRTRGAKQSQPCVATIPAMAAAITPEIPGPSLVLGHSLGGIIATAIAERRPDLVTHLVVVDSPPDVASRVAAKGHERVLRRPVLGPLLWRSMSRRTIRNGLRTAFAPGFDFPEFFVDDFRLLRWRTFAGAMTSGDEFISEKPLYDRVAGIAAPTTIVFGEMDQRLDPASLAGYASTEATVVTIADAGHTPTWETPDRVAEALRATIRR